MGAGGGGLLVLHGDEDRRTALANSRELVARACAGAGGGGGDCRLEVLAGARHMLLYDAPEISRRALQATVDWILERI